MKQNEEENNSEKISGEIKNTTETQENIEGIVETTGDEVFNEKKKKRRNKLVTLAFILFVGVGLGLVIGFNWLYIIDFAAHLNVIITTLLILLGVVIFFLFLYKDRILFKIFGVAKASYEDVFTTVFPSAVKLYKNVLPQTEKESVDASLGTLQKGGRQLIAYFAWRRTRRFIVSLFFSLLLGLFGMVGTMLLLEQNKLIKDQSHLVEAQRRSSLVFMMANIMDKIDEILSKKDEDDYHTSRKLNSVTIARLAALSQSMKPIRYLEGDDLIEKPLSPERGQLFLALANCKFDTLTMDKVFGNCNFNNADLKGSRFSDVKIIGANLIDVNFFDSVFEELDWEMCVFDGINLDSTHFISNLLELQMFNTQIKGATFYGCEFQGGRYIDSQFRGGDLDYSEVHGASFENVVFDRVWIEDVVFDNCYFSNVDFSNSELYNVEFTNSSGFNSLRFDSTFVGSLMFFDDIESDIQKSIKAKRANGKDVSNLKHTLKHIAELKSTYKFEKINNKAFLITR